MAIFLWLWQYISPIVMLFGGLYLLNEGVDSLAFVLGCLTGLIGLLIGIIGWADTVPPRWFWIKSKMDLAGNRFMTAIGYALQFFFLPAFIIGLIEYFE